MWDTVQSGHLVLPSTETQQHHSEQLNRPWFPIDCSVRARSLTELGLIQNFTRKMFTTSHFSIEKLEKIMLLECITEMTIRNNNHLEANYHALKL